MPHVGGGFSYLTISLSLESVIHFIHMLVSSSTTTGRGSSGIGLGLDVTRIGGREVGATSSEAAIVVGLAMVLVRPTIRFLGAEISMCFQSLPSSISPGKNCFLSLSLLSILSGGNEYSHSRSGWAKRLEAGHNGQR